MGTNKSTTAFLDSGDILSIKQHLEQSLVTLFHIMFNLDLIAMPGHAHDGKDIIPAHLLLVHGKKTACVNLHISRDTALLIAEGAGIDVSSEVELAVIQDVACEIVNIIGNNLRTFFSENTDVYFEIGTATACAYDTASDPDVLLNMGFQANPDARIGLGLICSEAQ